MSCLLFPEGQPVIAILSEAKAVLVLDQGGVSTVEQEMAAYGDELNKTCAGVEEYGNKGIPSGLEIIEDEKMSVPEICFSDTDAEISDNSEKDKSCAVYDQKNVIDTVKFPV